MLLHKNEAQEWVCKFRWSELWKQLFRKGFPYKTQVMVREEHINIYQNPEEKVCQEHAIF